MKSLLDVTNEKNGQKIEELNSLKVFEFIEKGT
jgi:hypothetical protein